MCEICGNNESRTLNHSRKRQHLLKLFKVMKVKAANGFYQRTVMAKKPGL
jgi:hypothetical protein